MCRRRALVALAALVAIAAACVPPEKDPDRIVAFDEETLMGQIQGRGNLVVGFDPSLAPLSFVASDGRPAGFLVELGRLIAEDLGVTVTFFPSSTEELLYQPDVGVVDIAFPGVPITEELAREHNLSNPYYVGHQRLLVDRGSRIDSVEDLRGKACSAINAVTGVPLERLAPDVRVVKARDADRCFSLLERRDVSAVTSTDVFLLEAAFRDPGVRITGERMTTEAFGPVLPRGASTFANYVSSVFGEAREEGDFQRLYERWIAAYMDAPEEPEQLTVSEAAALFPVELPVAGPGPEGPNSDT